MLWSVEHKNVLLEWYPQPGEDKPPVPLLKALLKRIHSGKFKAEEKFRASSDANETVRR